MSTGDPGLRLADALTPFFAWQGDGSMSVQSLDWPSSQARGECHRPG